MVKRFDIYLVNLDTELSDDPRNTRPGVVISPDELNNNLEHVIVAPLASTNAKYPTRIAFDFLNAERFIILDQIRTVEKTRLVKKIGELDKDATAKTLDLLQEMFAE